MAKGTQVLISGTVFNTNPVAAITKTAAAQPNRFPFAIRTQRQYINSTKNRQGKNQTAVAIGIPSELYQKILYSGSKTGLSCFKTAQIKLHQLFPFLSELGIAEKIFACEDGPLDLLVVILQLLGTVLQRLSVAG